MSGFRAFLSDDSAQGLIEYAMIIALVSLASVAAFKLVGHKTNNTLTDASNALSPVRKTTVPPPFH